MISVVDIGDGNNMEFLWSKTVSQDVPVAVSCQYGVVRFPARMVLYVCFQRAIVTKSGTPEPVHLLSGKFSSQRNLTQRPQLVL